MAKFAGSSEKAQKWTLRLPFQVYIRKGGGGGLAKMPLHFHLVT